MKTPLSVTKVTNTISCPKHGMCVETRSWMAHSKIPEMAEMARDGDTRVFVEVALATPP